MGKRRQEILGFDDRWLMLFGIPVVAIMVNAILFGNYTLQSPRVFFGSCLFIAIAYTGAFWLLLREGHYFLLKRFPQPGNLRRRFLYTALMAIGSYIIINTVLTAIFKPYFPEAIEPDEIVKAVTSFLFIALVISTHEALHLSNRLKLSILEREKLVKENINSQLEGLRSQVNPHFLFNSLNTLASIIPEDSDKGVNFVTKLAKVYRYMLESRNENLIPLYEELEFLDAYIYLIKHRFGENIKIERELNDASKDLYIIPLSLQITFENAIKHNVISKEKPLTISVYIDPNGKLVVKNTLQKKSIPGNSTKVGLQNIRNRYAFYTHETVDVITTHDSFSVMLPLLAHQQPEATHV